MSAEAKNREVIIETSLGTIEIELFEKEAPLSSENFVKYVTDGYYNGTIFHRVIDGFMIQGGGMTATMTPKPGREPIKNEATNGLKNLNGTLAMARTSVVDSATSQFFINVNDNAFLDHKDKSSQGYGYAVFGKVTKGMDVVAKIKSVRTTRMGMHADVPSETISIIKAELKK